MEKLQGGLDDALATDAHPFRRCQVALIWAVLCPAPFQTLLHQRCPQALVILAHYAVLLHYTRDIWQVNHTGTTLLRLVVNFLGPEYKDQLEWPLAAIRNDDMVPLRYQS